VATSYAIVGSAPTHLEITLGGTVYSLGATITLTGTPNFSNAFAQATDCGVIRLGPTTFVGGATGKRYNATTNGVINTNGAGATYLPGNAVGTATTGGLYV
jgi:hypothetical protein